MIEYKDFLIPENYVDMIKLSPGYNLTTTVICRNKDKLGISINTGIFIDDIPDLKNFDRFTIDSIKNTIDSYEDIISDN